MSYIEVYEWKAGQGRPYFSHKPGALEFIAAEGHIPSVGDVLVLPAVGTGDSAREAFILNGFAAPFRVIDREFLYTRPMDFKHDPVNTTGAKLMKICIYVRRLSADEYDTRPKDR